MRDNSTSHHFRCQSYFLAKISRTSVQILSEIHIFRCFDATQWRFVRGWWKVRHVVQKTPLNWIQAFVFCAKINPPYLTPWGLAKHCLWQWTIYDSLIFGDPWSCFQTVLGAFQKACCSMCIEFPTRQTACLKFNVCTDWGGDRQYLPYSIELVSKNSCNLPYV